MSNTDAASAEGFDPSKPFTTRDGQEVSAFVQGPEYNAGYVGGHQQTWTFGGKQRARGRSRNIALDLINTPTPTVAPTPAGDMAGEDDAAFVERMWKGEPYIGSSGVSMSDADHARLVILAREGARRKPVAGDGWQPISTAPKAEAFKCLTCGRPNYARVVEEKDDGSYGDGPLVRCLNCKAVYKFPAAPSPVPSDTGGKKPDIIAEAFSAGFNACEVRHRALPSTAPTHEAGSASEPVAWQYRWIGKTDWMPVTGGPGQVTFLTQESKQHEVRPLYAAPLASVDAVAVVTELAIDEAVDAYDWSRCRHNEKWHGGKCKPMSDANKASIRPMIAHAVSAAFDALRAAQQSGEARS